ncbi:MAG: hypothetical protein HY273_02440 [Gammaproteobacteria bacterium]|nr:hypothetical protein [Gammaproteobacteria bacterium]
MARQLKLKRQLKLNKNKVIFDIKALSATFGLLILTPAAYAEDPPHEPPDITGGITLIGQKIKSDHPEQATMGNFGSTLSVDLNFEKKVGDGKVTIWLMHAEGFDPTPGANADYEGASGAPGTSDYQEGFSDTRIAEAKYELPMTDNLTVTFGKISPQGYFDANNAANDQTRQFLAGPFVNNPVIPFPGHMATHAYPGGVVASFLMNETVTLQGGVLEAAHDYAGEFKRLMTIGEADAKMEVMDGEANLRFIAFTTETDEDPTNIYKISGFAVSADFTYDDDYIFFARYGSRNSATNAPDEDPKSTMSFGMQGPFGDVAFGLGYSVAKAKGKDLEKETWLEFYIQYALAEGVLAAIDYQSAKNPGFDSLYGTFTAIGARLQVDF